MKTAWKILGVLLVLGLVIGGLGCKQAAPAPAPKPSPATTAPAPSPPPPPAPPAQPITIRWSHTYTPTSFRGQIAATFKDLAEKYTNGRIKVEIFPSGQLYGTDTETTQATISNTIQVQAQAHPAYQGIDPSFKAFGSLPYFTDNKHVTRFFKDPAGGGVIEKSLEKAGLKPMFFYAAGPRLVIFKSNEPANTLDSFKGVKLGHAAGDVTSDMLKAVFGAIPVNVVAAERLTAIQTKLIDGFAWVYPDTIAAPKLHTFVPYMLDYVGTAPSAGTMSMIFWNSLSKDLQDIFATKVFPETSAAADKLAVDLDKTTRDNLLKDGVKFYQLSAADMKELWNRVNPLLEKYGKDLAPGVLDTLNRTR